MRPRSTSNGERRRVPLLATKAVMGAQGLALVAGFVAVFTTERDVVVIPATVETGPSGMKVTTEFDIYPFLKSVLPEGLIIAFVGLIVLVLIRATEWKIFDLDERIMGLDYLINRGGREMENRVEEKRSAIKLISRFSVALFAGWATYIVVMSFFALLSLSKGKIISSTLYQFVSVYLF